MSGAPVSLAVDLSFLRPEWLISTFGPVGVLAVVFAESGLLIGFFLPGDSMLFTTGLLLADGAYLHLPLWLMCLLVAVAAAAGDQFGYYFGHRVGPTVFRRPNSRLFNRQNVSNAHDFLQRYGARSIVLARFVPVVRTFVPIVAGASHMRYRTFLLANVIGGALWGSGVTSLGYFLGRVAFVHAHIGLILIGVVAASVLPIVTQLLRARHRSDHVASPGSPGSPGDATAADGSDGDKL